MHPPLETACGEERRFWQLGQLWLGGPYFSREIWSKDVG